MTRTGLAVVFVMAATAATVSSQDAPPSLRLRMLAAEDARDASAAGIAPLLDGMGDADADVRRHAVRALGRFEDETLVPHVLRMLADNDAAVRAEAANALAQAFRRAPSGAAGAVIARAAISREGHPLVRGALLLALGRFTYTSADEWRAAEVFITDALFPEDSQGHRTAASPGVLLSGLRGLQSLARQAPGKRRLHEVTVAALARLARPPGAGGSASAANRRAAPPSAAAGSRIRLLALQALRAGNITDPDPYQASMQDPDAAVRGLAMVPLFAAPLFPPGVLEARAAAAPQNRPSPARAKAMPLPAGLRRVLEQDPSAAVRLEALRGYLQQAAPDCDVVRQRFDDPSPHVAVMAIDGVARACRGRSDAVQSLTSMALGGPPARAWHRRAHALVALAQIDPGAAAAPVQSAERDQHPWIRLYAARALRHLVRAGAQREDPEVAALRRLSADADVNVASAAVGALRETIGHGADDEYLAALARDDRASASAGVRGMPTGYELILEAATALRGSPMSGITTPLLAALDRVSAEHRETSRDPRKALIEALATVSDPVVPERLLRYAGDFDPEIARAAAALVTVRTGDSVVAAPRPLPRAPLPSEAELDELASTKVVLQMADGGRVTIGLLPNEAPLNAARFVRLAHSGYFTGRTIHRVVPNFVAQGGSPGANEFAGDAAFSRDEVGMVSNADGTVGVSTRGRDTGDGQFYVNLADNTRLDHAYTVFGAVEAGRDVVERWMEGDVIASVTVTRSR